VPLVASLAACTSSPTPAPTRTPGTHVVVLEASGTTKQAYASWAVLGPQPVGPRSGRVDLPWNRTIVTRVGVPNALTAWSLSVGDEPSGGTYTCRITVDGRELVTERAAGGVVCEADLRTP
jgi:hypothetical protein